MTAASGRWKSMIAESLPLLCRCMTTELTSTTAKRTSRAAESARILTRTVITGPSSIDAERAQVLLRRLGQLGLRRAEELLVDDDGEVGLLEGDEGLPGAEQRAAAQWRVGRHVGRRHVGVDSLLVPARRPVALAQAVGGLRGDL